MPTNGKDNEGAATGGGCGPALDDRQAKAGWASAVGRWRSGSQVTTQGPIIALAVAATTMAVSAACKLDIRFAMLAGGFTLACLARQPALWLRGCLAGARPSILLIILPVFGFTELIRQSRCHQDLVALLIAPLMHLEFLALPAVVGITFLLASSLLSANAAAGVVSVVVVPVLMGLGIKAEMAGAAVLAGSWGAVCSVASIHAANIARLSATDPATVIRNHLLAAIAGLALAATVISVEAWSLVEQAGGSVAVMRAAAPVSLVRASLPLLPAFLLLIKPAVPRLAALFLWIFRIRRHERSRVSIPLPYYMAAAMFAASALTASVAGMGALAALAGFGAGVGHGLYDVILFIVAGMAFIGALEAHGVLSFLLKPLSHSPLALAACSILAALGTSTVTGSGDAAVTTVSSTLIRRAPRVGLRPLCVGSLAWLGGEMGRCLSPLAGVTATVAVVCRDLQGSEATNTAPIIGRAVLPVLAAGALCFCCLWRQGSRSPTR